MKNMETTFPRFIVDKPVGEDFSEGQSQTRLAERISDYIRKTDKDNIDSQTSIPRIIGVSPKTQLQAYTLKHIIS